MRDTTSVGTRGAIAVSVNLCGGFVTVAGNVLARIGVRTYIGRETSSDRIAAMLARGSGDETRFALSLT